MVAPSYPAEFTESQPGRLVGHAPRPRLRLASTRCRFGADLVAAEYARLLEANPDKPLHHHPLPGGASSYVRKYHPDLTRPPGARSSRPMVAMARVLRHDLRPGPQGRVHRPLHRQEGRRPSTARTGEVDAVAHLRRAARHVRSSGASRPRRSPTDDDFDPPHGGLGALFPITGGLLQAAGLEEDLLERRDDRGRGRGTTSSTPSPSSTRPHRGPPARHPLAARAASRAPA